MGIIHASPGVYTQELDLTTSIGALQSTSPGVVGTATKGPMNTRTRVTSMHQFISTFGTPSYMAGLMADRYFRRGDHIDFVRVGTYQETAEVNLMSGVTLAAVAKGQTPGTYGNALQVVVSTGILANTIKLSVLSNSILVESLDALTVGAAHVDEERYWETFVNANSDWITLESVSTVVTTVTAGTYDLTGGSDGDPADATDVIGAAGTGPSVPATGLFCLSNPEAVDINLMLVPGRSEATILAAMYNICENVRGGDCMSIGDVPYGYSVNQAVNFHNGTGGGPTDPTEQLNTSYGMLAWPWCMSMDQYSGANTWIAPSAYVAQACAYTDDVTNEWWQPAGLKRGVFSDVSEIEYSPTREERDLLVGYGNCVSYIQNWSPYSAVLMDARTLYRTTSALQDVGVRRLMIGLKKRVATLAKYFIQDPNDASSWRDFESQVEVELENLLTHRAITYGQVKCDASNNPATDQNRNIMNGDIMVQPIRAAKIIRLNFGILAQGVNFTEIEQQA